MHLGQFSEIIKALSDAADPFIEQSILERRKRLVSGLAFALDADIWMWSVGEMNPQLCGDAMVTSFVDGGFADETERAEFFRVMIHPDIAPAATAPLAAALAEKRAITRSREQLIDDESWNSSPLSATWRRIGLDDFIIGAYPVGDAGHSAIGLHRRQGKPRFTAQELAAVHAVVESVGWLHKASGYVDAASHVLDLSPRERQVIMYLINGDSRKAVARKLHLSEHTITDHLKEIYRKFGVRSRSALLAKFINGQTNISEQANINRETKL